MTEADQQLNIAITQEAPRGKPLLDDEPQTLAELFIKAVQKHRRPDALNFKRDGKWRSFSSEEFMTRAGHVALGLYSLGLRSGDKAAILAANSPEWSLADAGCQLAGVIDVPLYTTLSPDSIRYIVSDSGAKLLFVDNLASYERVSGSLGDFAALASLVFFHDDGGNVANAMSIEGLEERGRSLEEERPTLLAELQTAGSANDVATLIYTSGTTGEPKGVMLTHANIISNVIDSGEKYTFSAADVPLSVLPLSHVFERSAMYLYILNGMAVHYAESIDKIPDNLREVRPTIFVGVPRIFEKVYARAKLNSAEGGRFRERIFDWAIETASYCARAKEDGRPISIIMAFKHTLADRLVFSKLRDFFGGRLRYCITGGAALSDDIYLIFMGAGIPLMQGYGLTETSPVVSSNNPFEVKVGTVGKPIRNTKIRIASDGEIEVSGPGVTPGYYNKETATLEAFTADGWFRTGDIGEIDTEGFLRITDRKKELLKTSGGKYIAPSPIEGMIRSSRFVNQVVLIGNERKFPAALIVPNFEMLRSYAKHKNLDLRTPSQFCSSPAVNDLMERQIESKTEALAQYEKVKKFVLLENELTVDGGEMTPTLKIKRRVVDEKYKSLIDRLYEEN
ncbi:MAG: long-chain fatty acid--CoA ligase [Acidobacteriota bacterium]